MNADLAIVGAGPAGLAAATLAAEFGVNVVVYDEQTSPGGQIYRAAETSPVARRLGAGFARGQELIAAFRASRARHVPRANVWSLDPARALGVSIEGQAEIVRSRAVILATGAMERPIPVPGWTLPGVMTAGGAQILYKTAGLVPSGRVALAGTGPLLWLLAHQLLSAGVRIEVLIDTTPDENWRGALRHLPAFMISRYVLRGLALQTAVRRRVRVLAGVERIEALGRDRLDAVLTRRALHGEETIPADLLLLHQGVVPNGNLAQAAGIRHDWNDAQLAFVPLLDADGESSIESVWIAGDGGGIAGAEAAEERGRIAALACLHRLGRIDRAAFDRLARPIRARLASAERGRAFIDWLHRPAQAFRVPEGKTMLCRCEEVLAQDVVEAAKLGAVGPNQLKAFLRAGMGPCQGRFCALSVTETLAAMHGRSPGEIGTYRLRPPIKPITLAEFASLPVDEAARRAVER